MQKKKIKAVMATKMPKKKLKTEKIDAMIIMEKRMDDDGWPERSAHI